MKRLAGMTLLELLIAIAIFSLMIGAGYAGLDQGIAFEDRLKNRRVFWQCLDSVYSLMQTDLLQAARRTPRVSGQAGLAFKGYRQSGTDDGLLFRMTKGGNISFRDGPVNPYQRITYNLVDGNLHRTSRTDTAAPVYASDNNPPLLSGLKDIRVRYLISGTRWIDRWPQTTNPGDPSALPRAVELSLIFEDHNSYKWVFHVGTAR